ncbi:MAG: hypothetical protein WCY93_08375 [Anaerolineaceae bacterium]
MKKSLFSLILLFIVLSLSVPNQLMFVQAEPSAQMDSPDEEISTLPDGAVITSIEEVNPYFTVENYILTDGTRLSRGIINGPSKPPAGYEAEREASIQPLPSRGTIPDFPSYNWVFGCSAVSGAMIAAYYDRNGYPNMYAGPTNSGVMPITNTSWGTWSDGYENYPNNPLVASKNGVDGRSSRGSIDDYWVRYGSSANDPYITNGWSQHAWGTAIGDFMKTSQSAYGNTDGSTSFWNYTSHPAKYTCATMETESAGGGKMISEVDGTYGRKLFYEARGYTVTECYNQRTDVAGGFSLANFQAEIDAGHPVMINVEGHTMVGYGYEGSTIYIRDTWDSDPSETYTMPWGGYYQDMKMYAVSVVKLAPITSPPAVPTGVAASDGTYTDKVRVTWNASNGATYYRVFRNTSNTHTGETVLVSNHPASPFDDTTATPGTSYYYWVKACNTVGCSDYSIVDTGYRAVSMTTPAPPSGVAASFGTYTNKVRVSWNPSDGAAYYQVFRNTSNTHTGEIVLVSNHPASPFDDTTATPGTSYYYWVKACNAVGCSNYSSSAIGKLGTSTGFELFVPLIINGGGGQTYSLRNGNFEAGRDGSWTEYSNYSEPIIVQFQPGIVHSGVWAAWMGGLHNSVDRLSQTVTIPTSTPYLHYWYWIVSDDVCGFDYARVKVNGTTIKTFDLCVANNTGKWVSSVLDLSNYKGSTVTLMFEETTDGSLISNFYLDDVSLSSRGTAATSNPIQSEIHFDGTTNRLQFGKSK